MTREAAELMPVLEQQLVQVRAQILVARAAGDEAQHIEATQLAGRLSDLHGQLASYHAHVLPRVQKLLGGGRD